MSHGAIHYYSSEDDESSNWGFNHVPGLGQVPAGPRSNVDNSHYQASHGDSRREHHTRQLLDSYRPSYDDHERWDFSQEYRGDSGYNSRDDNSLAVTSRHEDDVCIKRERSESRSPIPENYVDILANAFRRELRRYDEHGTRQDLNHEWSQTSRDRRSTSSRWRSRSPHSRRATTISPDEDSLFIPERSRSLSLQSTEPRSTNASGSRPPIPPEFAEEIGNAECMCAIGYRCDVRSHNKIDCRQLIPFYKRWGERKSQELYSR